MDKQLCNNENIDLDIINNEQQSFLETTLGKVINYSVDTGLKTILPDMIEDDVIDIKNTFINEGFSEGLNHVINVGINLGKKALGIATGDFESISQAESAVEKGGIIENVSNVIDFTIEKVSDLGLIPEKIINIIKNGKDLLINNISSDIKNEFKSQTKNIDNLNIYTDSWKKSFEQQDFDQMEKYIKKIRTTLKKIMPIENLIEEAKVAENLHELIKNNNGNFDLTKEQKELAKLLK